jgi:hypothetical protein
MIVSGRVEMTPPPSDEAQRQLDLRYRLGAATADAYFEAGFTAVVQDIVIGPDHLPRYCSYIRSRPLYVVVLVPRVDAAEAREVARSKTAYRPGGYSVEALDAGLREETPRIGLWLDNSDQAPMETVEEVLARLDEARV